MGVADFFAGALGGIFGLLLAPFIFLYSFARGARAFHPDGIVYRAEVTPRAAAEYLPLGRAAERLVGPALVRLSAARRPLADEGSDVLGLGIRFGVAGDQDLLLGSFTGFGLRQLERALKTTDSRDFLDNEYHSVEPFLLFGVGRVTIEARGEAASGSAGATREERLARAAEEGRAVLLLSIRRERGDANKEPLVEVRLTGPSSVPSSALRFSPFHDGGGLRRVGLLAGIRWAVYPASQLGRRLRGR